MSRVAPRRLARIGLVLVAVSGCADSPTGPARAPRIQEVHSDLTTSAGTTVTLDGTVGVNPTNGIAVVSGTLTCETPASVDLTVKLSQAQKLRRVSTVVEATDITTIACTGNHFWSVALTPASGGFKAGDAAASVKTGAVAPPPVEATALVKLYWARK